MESQGQAPQAGATNGNANTSNIPPSMGTEFRAPRPIIPPAPFFPGLPTPGVHMPFLFPQSFMPPISGVGVTYSAEFGAGSHKRSPQHSPLEKPKPAKKKRAPRKKIEVVDLDDTKDDVEVLKPGGHWKDYWVIQLIFVRGEMNNIFSSPPKQGTMNFF